MSLEGVNYNLVNQVPAKKVPPGEYAGRVRCLYDEHTFAADVNAIGAKVFLGGKLPKGARVLEAVVLCPSLGATGIFDVGYQANGVDAADPNAFILAADAGGQAVKGMSSAGSAGLGKKFGADTQVELTFTEASASAEGEIVKVWLYYILD